MRASSMSAHQPGTGIDAHKSDTPIRRRCPRPRESFAIPADDMEPQQMHAIGNIASLLGLLCFWSVAHSQSAWLLVSALCRPAGPYFPAAQSVFPVLGARWRRCWLPCCAPGPRPCDSGRQAAAGQPWSGFPPGILCGVLWYVRHLLLDLSHHAQLRGVERAAVAAVVLVLFCLYLGLYHGLFGLLVSLLAGT